MLGNDKTFVPKSQGSNLGCGWKGLSKLEPDGFVARGSIQAQDYHTHWSIYNWWNIHWSNIHFHKKERWSFCSTFENKTEIKAYFAFFIEIATFALPIKLNWTSDTTGPVHGLQLALSLEMKLSTCQEIDHDYFAWSSRHNPIICVYFCIQIHYNNEIVHGQRLYKDFVFSPYILYTGCVFFPK